MPNSLQTDTDAATKESLHVAVSRLMRLQEDHNNAARGIQKAVAVIDQITGRLVCLLHATFPSQSSEPKTAEKRTL